MVVEHEPSPAGVNTTTTTGAVQWLANSLDKRLPYASSDEDCPFGKEHLSIDKIGSCFKRDSLSSALDIADLWTASFGTWWAVSPPAKTLLLQIETVFCDCDCATMKDLREDK